MSSFGYDFQEQFIRRYGAIGQIIAITAGFFLLIALLHLILFLVNQAAILYKIYETLPLATNFITWLKYPWSWITFLFLYRYPDFIGALLSLVWLFWIGGILKDFTKPVVIWATYLQGAIVGGVFAVLCYAVFPVFAGHEGVIYGASAGLSAIIAATATLVPDYTVVLFLLGPIRLRWIGLFVIVFNVFMVVTAGNPASALAQIGAAGYGFFAIRALSQGTEWHLPTQRIFSLFRTKPSQKIRSAQIFSNTKPNYKPTKPNQVEIDRILDKIASVGYENLTADEKQTLFNASRGD